MIEKLKSRKLWAAFVSVVILFFSENFGLSSETAQWITGIASSYIIGQGIADAGAQGKLQGSDG